MRFVEVQPGQVQVLNGEAPDTKADEVRIKVTACGICGTDLHLLHGMIMPTGADYPVRPGHEVAGIVAQVGSQVTDVTVGDAVVLHPLAPCGFCDVCLAGTEQLCENARILGIHEPGGMADELTWPASRLVKIGDLPCEQAALLPDAVATAWHALSRAEVPLGGTLVVIGAGGVGTHVLQLAFAVDPTIIRVAVVRSQASAQRLIDLGIEHVLVGLENCSKEIRHSIGTADVAIDFSGTSSAAAEGIRTLRRGGVLVVGSVIDERFDLRTNITNVVTREIKIIGSYSSSIKDLREVTQLAQSGAIDLHGSASFLVPLDDAPAAFKLLEERPPGLVRVVLIP